MGAACASGNVESSPEAAERSKEIERDLKERRKEITSEIKLLLLGAGDSGKSTFAKQMKILFCKGFQEEERQNAKSVIYANALRPMHDLCHIFQDNDIELDKKHEEFADLLASTGMQTITPQLSTAIQELWSLKEVKELFRKKKASLQLSDSAPYFFDRVHEIAKEDYSPTDEDMLHMRVMTSGISEMTFRARSCPFRLVDVGGQRSERRKWIHCFESVNAVLFFTALSEYDQTLFEDEKVNRMHESIRLFDEICNCKFFTNTEIVLFLNKKDLFRLKIKTVDPQCCFNEYTGGCDYKAALKFIEDKFKQVTSRSIFSHITCSTDTDNIRIVFEVVQESIIKKALDSQF